MKEQDLTEEQLESLVKSLGDISFDLLDPYTVYYIKDDKVEKLDWRTVYFKDNEENI